MLRRGTVVFAPTIPHKRKKCSNCNSVLNKQSEKLICVKCQCSIKIG